MLLTNGTTLTRKGAFFTMITAKPRAWSHFSTLPAGVLRMCMALRSSLAPLCLLCAVLLAGCAVKETPVPVRSRFPEYPPAALSVTLAQALAEKPIGSAAAINGGWGYTRKDAFVFSAPGGQRGRKRNMIPVESRLVRVRNEVEFTRTPTPGNRFAVLDYGTVSRTVGLREGRMYAVWRGKVLVLSEKEAPAQFAEAMKRPPGRRLSAAAGARTRQVSREYWFDVTETFGR